MELLLSLVLGFELLGAVLGQRLALHVCSRHAALIVGRELTRIFAELEHLAGINLGFL